MSSIAETGTVLDRIVAQTRIDLNARMSERTSGELRKLAIGRPDPIALHTALRQDTVTVIAEIKRASPSKGRFPVEIDPASVAAAYAAGGASAISCLTDGPFFQGSLDDLAAVTAVTRALENPIGVLRKDFMIDRYQVDEAYVYGASCILLIAACLSDGLMADLNDYALELGLSVLVEVHNEAELDRAMALEPKLVGINNRDLKTLKVDLGVTTRLASQVPSDVVLVGESGIFTPDHVQVMADAGVDAILVGESLILQDDRSAAVHALTGIRRSARATT